MGRDVKQPFSPTVLWHIGGLQEFRRGSFISRALRDVSPPIARTVYLVNCQKD